MLFLLVLSISLEQCEAGPIVDPSLMGSNGQYTDNCFNIW